MLSALTYINLQVQRALWGSSVELPDYLWINYLDIVITSNIGDRCVRSCTFQGQLEQLTGLPWTSPWPVTPGDWKTHTSVWLLGADCFLKNAVLLAATWHWPRGLSPDICLRGLQLEATTNFSQLYVNSSPRYIDTIWLCNWDNWLVCKTPLGKQLYSGTRAEISKITHLWPESY